MTFLQKLHRITASRGLGLCVGLDPDPGKLPPGFSPDLDGISRFLFEAVRVASPYASAFKVNTAFYEAWGSEGWALLEKIAAALPESSLRIADAKRGDIGNTARHYARAFFERLPFDAITLSPYMGSDTLQPFLSDPQKGAFVLALTTNAGSADLQRFSNGKRMLFQHILRQIPFWAPAGNLGAVVGATHPQDLKAIREEFPDVPLLIPGVGAQGGDIEAIVEASKPTRAPVLVNVSRGVLYPENGLKFPDNIAAACEHFQRKLNDAA